VWGTERQHRRHAGWAGAAGLLCALLAALAPAQPAPGAPDLDALPRPMAPPVDLEALARGYAHQADATPPGLSQGPGLLVFVSLAMPRAALQRLLDQAERAGASVVLRGFLNGSLRQTVQQLQALIGQRRIAVQIDPPAFDRFGIARVPSLVLVRDGARPAACAAGQCPPPADFVQVAGDVSLDYALVQMQRAAPSLQAEAAWFLARLQPGGRP
jgi:conjugal transfer pilus assembly protein TrbC